MIIQKLKLISYLFGIKTIYCSTCRQLMNSYEDAEFVLELGECGNCDHNRYTIIEEVLSFKEMEE